MTKPPSNPDAQRKTTTFSTFSELKDFLHLQRKINDRKELTGEHVPPSTAIWDNVLVIMEADGLISEDGILVSDFAFSDDEISRMLAISKRFRDTEEEKEMSLKELLARRMGYTEDKIPDDQDIAVAAEKILHIIQGKLSAGDLVKAERQNIMQIEEDRGRSRTAPEVMGSIANLEDLVKLIDVKRKNRDRVDKTSQDLFLGVLAQILFEKGYVRLDGNLTVNPSFNTREVGYILRAAELASEDDHNFNTEALKVILKMLRNKLSEEQVNEVKRQGKLNKIG